MERINDQTVGLSLVQLRIRGLQQATFIHWLYIMNKHGIIYGFNSPAFYRLIQTGSEAQ